MKAITTKSVGGTLIVIVQRCGLGLLTTTDGKNMDQGRKKGNYVHTGGIVGVAMDTTKGELSFVVNGVNLGVAYDGMPLDKLLVPCALLRRKGDSVELII